MNRRGPDKIIVYKRDPCGFCRAAIRYLRDIKGVPIEVVDITGDMAHVMRLMEESGQRTVPQIWVGNTHVGGYDDLRALDASGGLDPLLEEVRSHRDRA